MKPSGQDDADAGRPPHVKRVKGRWYWDPPDRLRRSHDLRTVALGADQANAWDYARTLNRDHLRLDAKDAVAGSVTWLLEAFLRSERFERLAPATRRDYRWLALRVLAPVTVGAITLGTLPATSLKPRHADAIHERIKREKGAATAHYAARFARRVWKWGARRELVDAVNPWSGMELAGLPARTALWTPAQVTAVVAEAERRGRPSLGLATVLAYWLAHRQADILNLTWTALDAGIVETRKTGRALPVDVAAYPELEAALRGARRASTHVVVREAAPGDSAPARPYQRHTFGHEWRRVANAAGIPPTLQFRDLRATALTELSDAGVDVLPLRTHSGHQDLQMPSRYVRPTREQFRTAAARRVAHRSGAGRQDEHPANGQGNRQGNRETGGG